MSVPHALANLIALTAAVTLAGLLGIPVYDEIQHVIARASQTEGMIINPLDSLGFYGVGPLSGLTLFVVTAPLTISVAPTLLTKIIGVGGAFLGSAGMSAVMVLAGRGQTVGAALLGIVALLILVALFAQQGRMQRAKTLATERLRRDVVRLITGITRCHASPTPESDQAATPDVSVLANRRALSGLVERMALGVVWQAATNGDPWTFAQQVQDGLADLAQDFEGNRRADPEGIAARTAQACARRVGGFLNGSDLDPTWDEILAPADRARPSTRNA
ncbi:hypothetical protein [Pararhodospirillum oryzae]|uniref:Uncharacterized protein n=1 Tax=Pararhodospirillum oryzae TaxID=478448 RepID=A0A512H9A4_9PROT|nr:hypothetical protein [Pararhodospirillum oryzae]GEO81998.1 hypothetical protein ROR02_21290 [Pararhodospirillum oryzae]